MKQTIKSGKRQGVSLVLKNKKTTAKVKANVSKGASLDLLLKYSGKQHVIKYISPPVGVFDHRSNKFIFVNAGFTQLIGQSIEECYSQELNDFAAWMNTRDLLSLQGQITDQLNKVFKEFIFNDSQQLSYTVNFRLNRRDINDKPISVLAQCSVIEWKKNKTPAITLNILTDLSHYKHHQKQILRVILFDEISQQWNVIFNKEFLCVPDMLGAREKEIMTEILLDKSAVKIATEKSMSVYTVRSHWRSVLHKTNCKTQKELKHMAQMEGWI